MTSKLAMPVVLIARLSLAKCRRSGGDGDVEAGIEQAFDAWEALASSPRNSAGFWASSCTWPVNVVSTPKLVRFHTSWLEYASELMVSS